ncbi:MAG TPA: YCF48-related protein [Terriglobales bacterium]|jgi:photosystem II stability/assembly factor-like uncharacterized protein|nr:YCF48-related protein [Terriglobales bacterium]
MFYNPAVRTIAAVFTTVLAVSLFGLAQPPSVQSTGFNSNLRGVSVSHTRTGKNIVWASGTKGIILRSFDDGKSWKQLKIADAPDLDFRGIQAFGTDTAYVMSSGDGEKSRIYKTTDGGTSWRLQYSDKRPGFFLDSIACYSRIRCFALSDPVDGKFLILTTTDGGEHWKQLPRDKMPSSLPTEGAFAASGTSIALCGDDIYFGTGGPSARIFHSINHGQSWVVVETPVASGNSSSGIFSVACQNRYVVAVGGDYKNPEDAERVAAYSNDRGKTWHLANRLPLGYRSCVRIAAGTTFTVGPNGEDISLDYGANWKSADTLNLNAAALITKGIGYAVGPNGTFKHLQLQVLDLIHRHRQREKEAAQ